MTNWCEKPLAVIAAMAFLFVWTAAAILLDPPMVGYLFINLALWTFTLLTVLLVHAARKQDIRALQAKVDTLIRESSRRQAYVAEQFTEDEVLQIRDMLKRESNDQPKPRDRDQRPSLF